MLLKQETLMCIKYAIRMPRFMGGKPSGKADGMYIRAKDRLMTDHPPNAQLFDTVTEAEGFIDEWRKTTGVKAPEGTPLYIVEVETREILKRQVRVLGAR